MKIKDIVFWFIILGLVVVALWMLHGSPTDTSAIVAIAVFAAASEILIWKSVFSADKKTAIGFEKVKSRFDKIDKQLNEITYLIKR